MTKRQSKRIWVIAFLLLGPLPGAFFGCRNCDEGGSDTCRYVTSIALKAFDNSDSLTSEIVGAIPGKALKVELSVMDSTVVCFRPAMTSSFISVANATMCKEYTTRDMDQPRDFRFTSDADFDAAHPAGSDLTDLFYSKSYKSLSTGIHTHYLRSSPSTASVHRITLTCELGSGKTLTSSLPAIQLLP